MQHMLPVHILPIAVSEQVLTSSLPSLPMAHDICHCPLKGQVGSVLGLVLVQWWFNLVQCRLCWSNFDSVLVHCWFSFGSMLVQFGFSFGSCLFILVHFGSVLVQFWFRFGVDLVWFSSGPPSIGSVWFCLGHVGLVLVQFWFSLVQCWFCWFN